MKKRISIFGSTGVVGQKGLSVLAQNQGSFELICLSGHSNHSLLIEQALRYKPRYVLVSSDKSYKIVKDALKDGIEVLSGEDWERALAEKTDVILMAISGIAAIKPTFSCLGKTKTLAMANKETIVCAGKLFTSLAEQTETKIIPVDSEHSGIFQCLLGEDIAFVEEILITASGGPFRNKTSIDELRNVSAEEALNHPNWTMGPKITIDSATMINKAFEIIEASILFNISTEKIKTTVHPQSIVHSIVCFIDGSWKANLGFPDMITSVSYALNFPTRKKVAAQSINFERIQALEFREPNSWQRDSINLAYTAFYERKMIAFTVANEKAVSLFLRNQIKFTDIFTIITESLEKALPEKVTSAEDIYSLLSF
jgi:1-deoxy-D-xylulose-5-phosphate reductoisomerase